MTAPDVTSTQPNSPQRPGAQLATPPPTSPQSQPSGQRRAGAPFPWRYVTAAAVLAAGQIWWSAAPLSAARGTAGSRSSSAIITATLSLGQVAVAAAPSSADDDRFSPADGSPGALSASSDAGVARADDRRGPGAGGAAPSRAPGTPAVLGAAIVGFLLAVHMAESRADVSVLRRQLPLVGIGLGLSALAVGAAALPSLPTGGSLLAGPHHRGHGRRGRGGRGGAGLAQPPTLASGRPRGAGSAAGASYRPAAYPCMPRGFAAAYRKPPDRATALSRPSDHGGLTSTRCPRLRSAAMTSAPALDSMAREPGWEARG